MSAPPASKTPRTDAPRTADDALAEWLEDGGIEPIADEIGFLAEQLFERSGHLRGHEAVEEVAEADIDHPWTQIEALHWKAGYVAGRGEVQDTHAALLAALEALADAIEQIGYETGVCCCGGDVSKHTVGDGHSPVDQGAYYMEPILAAARAAITQATTKP